MKSYLAHVVVIFLLVFYSTDAFQAMLSSAFHGSTMRVRYLRTTPQRAFFTRSAITMMPEGPEVRTLVDQLQGGVGRRLVDFHFMSGRYVRNGKPDGFQEFASTMTPLSPKAEQSPDPIDTILSWNAKGKFIYIILDDGAKDVHRGPDPSDFQRSIWITLGMTGKFVNEKIHETLATHGRWYMELLDTQTLQKQRIYYHDARNFGTVKFCLSRAELDDKLQKLGADILETSTTTENLFVEIWSKKNPTINVCKFLMNQSNISGIGNYILAEGLYRAVVDPFASLQEIPEPKQRLLFRELQSVAVESYAAQGMTRPKGGAYATVDGSRGNFEMELQCYGRQFCARGDPVIQDTDGPHGRTIWYTKRQLLMPLRERREGVMSHSNKPPPKRTPTPPSPPEAAWSAFEPGKQKVESSTELLLSTLHEPGWKSVLAQIIAKDYNFQKLADFLQEEVAQGRTLYPPHSDVFAALNSCPLEKVKVVCIGQDPYHGPTQAHGLSFSVQRGIPPPPSLKNILKEAMEDVGIEPVHGNLEHWAQQGVLLLNTVLTVRQGEANSHKGKGWEEITDGIVQHLNENKEGLVFLLFGNPAHKKASSVDGTKHTLIKTSHPSPLGASKTSSPFLGSRCFSRCNQALIDNGFKPIDWNVR